MFDNIYLDNLYSLESPPPNISWTVTMFHYVTTFTTKDILLFFFIELYGVDIIVPETDKYCFFTFIVIFVHLCCSIFFSSSFHQILLQFVYTFTCYVLPIINIVMLFKF